MKKVIVYPIIIILAAAGLFILKTLSQAGSFKNLNYHSELSCETITGLPGSEDIDMLGSIAFISSDDRRKRNQEHPPSGAIYTMDLSQENDKPALAHGPLPFPFHPHGISIFTGKDGNSRLFVINHRKTGHYIEIFSINGRTITHLESVMGSLLISPNDVAAVGKRDFYVTNDHGTQKPGEKFRDDFLQLPRASVVYYNGKTFSYVVQNVMYANSLYPAETNRLFLTTTVGKTVIEYSRNPETGTLTEIARGNLDSGLDNLHIDNQGRILVASHPKLLAFSAHAKDATKKSPSQVLELNQEGDSWKAKEIMLDDGSLLSGSSVAAGYNNQVLVGSVFEPHILKCVRKDK